ncbi:MAG: hypothetical protein ACSLFQ_12360, partial [Thermoanaerobaculia bacterium]
LRLLAGRLLVPLVIAAATVFAAFGVGRVATRFVAGRFFPAAPLPPADPATDFLIGYPLFGLLAYLVALVSAGAIAQSLVLFAGIALGAIALRDIDRNVSRVERSTATVAIGWCGAAVILLIGALHAQAPAFTLDEVAYHLAIPRQWALAGSAIDLPLLSHSYFPLGLESADLPGIALLDADGAMASHFVHLVAAASTALLLFRWIGGTAPGAAAWLAIVATPGLLVTAGWSWNEWPLLGLVLIALERARELASRERLAGAATLTLALAAGMMVKYTFALAALAIVIATAVVIRKDRVRSTLLGRALLLAALSGSAFLIRNLLLTGNPIAPFFQPDAPSVGGFRWTGDFFSTASGYLFEGRFLDESLGAALPALAIAGLLVIASGDLFARLATAGFSIAAIFLLLQAPSARILIPFLVVPAAFAVASVGEIERARWRTALTTILLLAAFGQLHLAAFYTVRTGVAPLAAGLTSDEDFLAAQRRDYPAVRQLDAALPADSRTLVLGTNEIFWFSRPVLGGGNADGPRISRWLGTGDLDRKIAAEGVTHVAVFPQQLASEIDPLDRRAAERATVLDESAAEALRGLIAGRGTEVARNAEFVLYQLR